MNTTSNNMKPLLISILLIPLFNSCGIYSFSGVSISKDIKSVQIVPFTNSATQINPQLTFLFQSKLEDKFIEQTNLSMVRTNGDLSYEGNITEYKVAPASSNQTRAVQNRLTISIKIKFFNNFDEKQNFDKVFSHYIDFDSSRILEGAFEQEQVEIILEKMINDIFLASLANW